MMYHEVQGQSVPKYTSNAPTYNKLLVKHLEMGGSFDKRDHYLYMCWVLDITDRWNNTDVNSLIRTLVMAKLW